MLLLGVTPSIAPVGQSVSPASAAETISYNFNTAGDLAANFNSYVNAGTITESASGGIGNTGAIEVNPLVTTNAVLATKDGYSLGPVGSTYTFTSQMRSFANSGYSGMGFTSLTPASDTASGSPYHPNDAIGISVHGGGYVFHNGTGSTFGNWGTTYSGTNNLWTISRVDEAGIATACDDATQDTCWYQVVFRITRDSATTFDARVELYGSSQSGTLDSETPLSVVEFRDQTNSTLTSANLLYSYINFSGQRMKYFDNFQVDLAGGASVIEAGKPVVLTSSASESTGVVTVAGNVTDDGGEAVTDRGFVYGASTGPTVSGLKVASGTGTGSFSAVTPSLAPGTYYFRTYATNDEGTSYGSETSLNIKGSQVISWAPNTSLVLADSGLTLSATLTTGDGTLGYTVVNSGTTACTISGSTLSFASIGSGANGCEVRPTASSTDAYNAKTDASTVTFEVTRGTFAISSPSSKVGVSSSSFTDVCTSTCDVTGFAPADQVLVVVSKSDGTALSGRVRVTTTTGLTQSQTGYQSDATAAAGHPELSFIGTQAEVNAALETLKYKGPAGGGDEILGISATLSGSVVLNGRYYQEITTIGAIDWEDARCKAKYGDSSAHDDTDAGTHSGLTQTNDNCTNTTSRRQFNGLNGYLANITSLVEHEFLMDKADATAWIGGADIDTEGTWTWVDGPEAGDVFYLANTSGIERRQLNTIPGESEPRFNYFSDGEPNNASTTEHFAEFGYGGHGVGSSWNDCRNGCGRTAYLVEYGGDGGTALKEAATTFTVGAPTAPLQVTGASATAGNSQVALSWSAPDSGGSAITDYVVEQFDADTSTWNILTDGVSTATSFTVTGLTNGTSYSFRVSAKNVVGTGTVSATVTATPVTPPAPAPSSGGGSGGGTTPPTPTTTPTSPAIPRILTPPQPIPRPSVLQGPVTSPGRGFDPNAGTRATIGGSPATVTQQTLPGGGLSVTTGAFQMGVALSNPSSGGGVDTNNPSNRPELRVPQGQSTTVNGGGLLPGSQLQVWLPGRPGSTPKELARVPVRTDGSFEAELSFTASRSDTPIAIGRQVMQVTGYDENGNQTVVDMTINVAQGPISPEQNHAEGALPQLTLGASLATSAGFPTPVTVVPLPDQNLLSVGDGQWLMTVSVEGEQSSIQGTSEAPEISMTQGSDASASGEGFLTGTTASVWMFSEPTLMATVPVGADGTFTLEFFVDPQFLPAGNHTLQVQGVGEDGFIKAANLGVLVEEVVVFTASTASGLLGWVALVAALFLAMGLIIFLARRRSSKAKRALGRTQETPSVLHPALN